jgi:hypothetical protein
VRLGSLVASRADFATHNAGRQLVLKPLMP